MSLNKTLLTAIFLQLNLQIPKNPRYSCTRPKKGKEVDADLILATDPDADRVGIAVKSKRRIYTIQRKSDNHISNLLFINKLARKGNAHRQGVLVKTIVTTEILPLMAEKFNVEIYDVLTGFKYIADIIVKTKEKNIYWR